jgi:hypothetical protein
MNNSIFVDVHLRDEWKICRLAVCSGKAYESITNRAKSSFVVTDLVMMFGHRHRMTRAPSKVWVMREWRHLAWDGHAMADWLRLSFAILRKCDNTDGQAKSHGSSQYFYWGFQKKHKGRKKLGNVHQWTINLDWNLKHMLMSSLANPRAMSFGLMFPIPFEVLSDQASTRWCLAKTPWTDADMHAIEPHSSLSHPDPSSK